MPQFGALISASFKGAVPAPDRLSCWVPSQDIGELGLGINIVHLGCNDQGIHEDSGVASALGAGEKSGFPSQRYVAQCALGRVVCKKDMPILKEHREGIPPALLGHGADRLCELIMLR